MSTSNNTQSDIEEDGPAHREHQNDTTATGEKGADELRSDGAEKSNNDDNGNATPTTQHTTEENPSEIHPSQAMDEHLDRSTGSDQVATETVPPMNSTTTTTTATATAASSVQEAGVGSSEQRKSRGGVSEPFPEKLHRMLETCDREGLSDVVSFFPHGRAFAIHKPRRFVRYVCHRRVPPPLLSPLKP